MAFYWMLLISFAVFLATIPLVWRRLDADSRMVLVVFTVITGTMVFAWSAMLFGFAGFGG